MNIPHGITLGDSNKKRKSKVKAQKAKVESKPSGKFGFAF